MVKILFINTDPNNSIHTSYFYFMKLLKEKNIEFYLHTNKSTDIPVIFEILEKAINKEQIIANIEEIKNVNITHVFYRTCYNLSLAESIRTCKIKEKFKNCKICYYNYGYAIVDNKFLGNAGYNSEFFNYVDYYFMENKLNIQHYSKRISNKKIKYHDVGCVKLMSDNNTDNKLKKSIEDKEKDEFFYIMYCPRWHKNFFIPGPDNGCCTYDLYIDYFINLVNKNPKIKFIFRPHPLTSYSIEKVINVSKSNPRIIINKTDYYYDIFKYINVFISDSSTLLAEALNFSTPIIYTEQTENVFHEFGEKIKNSFYIVKNENELDTEINNLLKNKDRKKELRIKYVKEFYDIYKNPLNKIFSILSNENEDDDKDEDEDEDKDKDIAEINVVDDDVK